MEFYRRNLMKVHISYLDLINRPDYFQRLGSIKNGGSLLKIPSYRASLIILANILPVTWPIVHFNQVSVTCYDNVRPLSRLLYLSTLQILPLYSPYIWLNTLLTRQPSFPLSFSTLTFFFFHSFLFQISRINLLWILTFF